MSRTRDLIELAMGNVRVPVTELTIEEKTALFQLFGTEISRHYCISRGGFCFKYWKTESFISQMDDLIGDGFRLAKKFHPKAKNYDIDTRIVELARLVFRLPSCVAHSYSVNTRGTKVGLCRVCLTQDGAMYLEWYEAIEGERYAEIISANYELLSKNQTAELNEKLQTILRAQPLFLNQFGQRVLELLEDEVKQREARLKRDRDLFSKLSTAGQMFDISLA